MDRGRQKKLIRLDDDQDGGWVSVSSGTGSPGQFWSKGHKTVVVLLWFRVLADTWQYFLVSVSTDNCFSIAADTSGRIICWLADINTFVPAFYLLVLRSPCTTCSSKQEVVQQVLSLAFV